MSYIPGLGLHVHKVETNCRIEETVNCFLITGGAIFLTYLYATVTTLIGDDNAMTLAFQHDEVPTGAITVFCTGTAINTDVADTIYDCDGDPANGLRVHTPGGGAGAGLVWPGGWIGGDMGADVAGRGWILGAGRVQWLAAGGVGDANDDGQITVDLFYIPLEEGVAVVAE